MSTGGSSPQNVKKKRLADLTVDDCVIESARYCSKTEWRLASPKTYEQARRNGWIERCSGHMRRKSKWSKDACIVEAKKFDSEAKWRKYSSSSYSSAVRNGWKDDCLAAILDAIESLTRELCIADARRFSSMFSWRRERPNYHNAAQTNGWLGDCLKVMPESVHWTRDMCLEDAKKYESLDDWRKRSPWAAMSAQKNGWMKECRAKLKSFKIPNSTKGLKKMCVESALPYPSIAIWKSKHSFCYRVAKANSWLEECSQHMKPVKKLTAEIVWSKEMCLEEAKKHLYRSAWKNNSKGGFAAAIKNGWFQECVADMKLRPGGSRLIKWTKDKCIAEAQKYVTKMQWIRANMHSYQVARKNGWMDSCCAHMASKRMKRDQY